MKGKWNTWLAWTLVGLVSLGSLLGLIFTLAQPAAGQSTAQRIGGVFWILFPVGFGFMAALILTYQPRNLIGWLLMLPALTFTVQNPLDNYLATFQTPPLHPTAALELILWFSDWSWVLLIFPLLLIALLFPTGRLLSAQWKYVLILLIVTFVVVLGTITFAPDLGPGNDILTLPNPVGFLPDSIIPTLTLIFGIFFILSIILCIGSIFVRYWRAALVEREQLQWLWYAGGLFAAFYLPIFAMSLTSDIWEPPDIFVMLFPLVALAFPITIAIAILRYRLWDIDVIIRKTLVYGILSVILGLVYFGAVTLAQSLFEAVTGERSPVAIVISTLAIAALFGPLRRRIQNAIDRRFYRHNYDAEKALQAFALSARDETDLDSLTAELLHVVEESLQPAELSLWLGTGADSRRKQHG